MELSLATPLMSRDGGLTKDALLYNCYWELNSIGQKVVVGRKALTPDVARVAAQGQAMYSVQAIDYMVLGDVIWGVGAWSGIASQALPGVSVPNLRMTVINGNITASGVSLAMLKSTRDAWSFNSSLGPAPVKIGGTYPSPTVPGIAYLDGTYYVMDQSGQIFGSNLEDPTTWPVLNFIATDRGLGRAVAIFRHLNYIAAFCERGLQFFYDAGSPPPGSPLLPVMNATTTIGCAHADTIQSIDDTTVFMSVDASGGRAIKVIRGLTVSQLSDANVERVLAANPIAVDDTQVYSLMYKVDGHTFYLLTINGVTLCCDIDLGYWMQWGTFTGGADTAFDPGFVLRNRTGVASFLMGRTSGKTYSLSGAGTEQVHSVIRTRSLDAGSPGRKFLSELALLGDTVSNTIGVRYSDDDGQTWKGPRTIDLSLPRKRVTRLGSFFRRIFEFSYFSSSPATRLRLESMVLPDRNLPAQSQPEVG